MEYICNMFIIGVVGQIASGKGILVKYLIEKLGFISYSLSSAVHREIEKKGIKKYTRQMLQDMGDELRREFGDEVLAQRIIKAINEKKKDKIVIEGIRNPGEIEFLRNNSNFILIGVKAIRKLRYKRLLIRGKKWDPKTYEEFLIVDKRDIGIDQNNSGQQVGKCLAYCDYVLTNNKDLKDFQRKVERLMGKLLNIKS
ncbi:hypothetical protein CO165_00620 [Candidatus Roizmanbacteria bacterium CG_4_9_14_3_um_filter_33_18]|uniref:Dephospho-CoA kinase n=2 Tax=Candidatus Roizmaniibacteriota TaxID=1752723 RepID=A0A2M7XZ22_9BACT|nr:MAG: hypothetical protein CO165_00620 [Candidatus Roizmanbacteria bacterium CG_4_9_14_3_um_filter_33_18]